MTIPQLKRLTESKEEIERAKSQFKERIRRIENKYKVDVLIDLKSEVRIKQ